MLQHFFNKSGASLAAVAAAPLCLSRVLKFQSPSLRLLTRACSSVAVDTDALNKFAQAKQTPVSLQEFTDWGKHPDLFKSCAFLRNELPVRYAHIIKEIDDCPDFLLQLSRVQTVRGWYLRSFQDMVAFPEFESIPVAQRDDYAKRFTELLGACLQRHAPVVPTVAQGVLELKRQLQGKRLDRPIHYFLDRIYMSRIGMRMLTAQHVELFGDHGRKRLSIVDENCDVAGVIRDAAENARFLCEQYYCASPSVEISKPQDCKKYPYIPSHLYHMCFELLKNSMRAVIEKHGEDSTLPPIKVVVVVGSEDLTIKISDIGGGIPRSGMGQVFGYLYTTAELPEDMQTLDAADTYHAPLAGLGYGLPLSRLYARYMGGDLSLISMDGYGTDAYIYLKKSAHAAGEVLPTYDEQQIRHYSAASQMNDWLERGI